MSEEKVTCDVLVIGAGVIGLSIASKLAPKAVTIVLDRYPKFGQETSSRNSEVIHSGIYYPKDSSKTELCIRGRELLYDYCKSLHVPFANCGKYVVATNDAEVEYLEKLTGHCDAVGVEHGWASGEEVMKTEPLIQVIRAVYLPRTGIVDSHVLMQSLETQIQSAGGMLAYRHQVKSITKKKDSWSVEVESEGAHLEIEAAKVINCAGLGAADLSNQALGTQKYEHRYCRGRYFVLGSKYVNRFKHLIYPVPQKDGLGVHVTIDMAGFARLGPDVDWAPGVSYAQSQTLYECDWESIQPRFVTAAQKYLPQVSENDLSPGLIGIRPKLFLDGVASPEFLIEDHGGFVHCLGIESPGLTSALAIAERVQKLV